MISADSLDQKLNPQAIQLTNNVSSLMKVNGI